MSVSKTRQKLVDVARQLFAKNGIANTTMNDIAVASGKGRRTLYTYFSRKEDVYYAVIESELERLSDKLDEVANCKMRPQDKIIELIYTHLSMIKETVVRNGNLRAEFFRNIWMVENIRDVMAVENTQQYRGLYHVLGGVISPMDGIGPSDLEIESLVNRVKEGTVKEVILALSSTMEGDTTNFYIFRKLAGCDVKITVIARGISIGDELQYTDEVTLGRSIVNRVAFTGTL